MSGSGPKHLRWIAAAALVPLALVLIGAGPGSDVAPSPGAERGVSPGPSGMVFGSGAGSGSSVFRSGEPALQEQGASKKPTMPDPRDAMRMVPTMLLYGVIWMAPMAALMVTAFVRINIVLVLLRQALGSLRYRGTRCSWCWLSCSRHW